MAVGMRSTPARLMRRDGDAGAADEIEFAERAPEHLGAGDDQFHSLHVAGGGAEIDGA